MFNHFEIYFRRKIIHNLSEPAKTMYALLQDRLSILRDEWFHEAFPNSISTDSSFATSNGQQDNKHHNENTNTIRFTLGIYTLVQCGLIRPKVLSGTGKKGKRQIKYEKVCTISS